MNTVMQRAVSLLAMSLLAHNAMAEAEGHESPGHEAHSGVVVFTTHELPRMARLDQADQIFFLDAADAALQTLTFAHPGTEAQARAQASAVLQSPAGEAAIAALQSVGEGIALAWQHGVRKLPAVMVGGDRVVYGVFDVGEALVLIEQDISRER